MMRKGLYIVSTGVLDVIYPEGSPISARQNMTDRAVVDVPDAYPETKAWNVSKCIFEDDFSALNKELLALVDDARESMQMQSLTPGGAKKYVYNRKAQEAISAQGVLATVLNALTLVDKKKKYPFAYAESVVTGETLSAVLARFETGMTVAAAENARIEAVAMKAKRDIRAATTAAQKRAAYAAIAWTVVVP
jgi:hypothetical protein